MQIGHRQRGLLCSAADETPYFGTVSRNERGGWSIVVAVLAALTAGCSQPETETAVVVRGADEIKVVDADEAERLLDEGASRAAGNEETVRTDATTVSVVESGRSFQTRLGTALATFNGCLQERGFQFVGIPGQTDDPTASDPDYLPSLIACNNESGIANVLQEQGDRQAALTADDKKRLNEDSQVVFECLLDRGWDFGALEPNQNGVLSPSSFPDDINARRDEFNRDLDACGWNDLDLG